MKIEVTREIIKETSGIGSDTDNCVAARAVTIETGRPARVYIDSGMFLDGKRETFDLDAKGVEFVRRYILYGRHHKFLFVTLQPTGSFEISWNPPPKNWQYRIQDIKEKELALTI